MPGENADIELLITANAAQAKAEMSDLQNQINELKGAANSASGSGDENSEGEGVGIGAMVSKFGHMGRALRVVNPELAHMAHGVHLLELLADPVTIAAVAVAGLAFGLYKIYENSKKVEEAELAEHLKIVNEQTKEATKGFEAYAEALAKGKSNTDALVISSVAFTEALFKEKEQALAGEIAAMQQLKIHLEEEIRLWNTKKNAREADGLSTTLYEQHIAGLEEQLKKTTETMAADSVELRQHAADAAAGGEIIKKLTADEKQANSEKGKSLEELLMIVEDLDNAEQKRFAHELEHLKGTQVGTLSPDSVVTDADAAAKAKVWSDMLDQMALATGETSAKIVKDFQSIGDSIVHSLSGVAKPAFDDYVTVLSHMQGVTEASAKGMIKALQDQVKHSIITIGEDASVHALYETALMLASVAVGDVTGATAHGLAAAEFGIVAAAAGIAAAASGGMDGGSSSGGSGGGGGGSGPNTTTGGAGGYPGNTIQVFVFGTLDARDAENLANQLDAARTSRSLN